MFGLNFLNRIFSSFSKSESRMEKFGVFIRSSKSEDEIIEGCQKLLRDMKSEVKVVSIKKENAFAGLKVFLNGGSSVPEMIKNKFLFRNEEDSTIHALTTNLIVHDAFPATDEEFTEDLRNQMQGLGTVLEISQIPMSEKYPDIGTGKWKVVLDVPEVEELDIFKENGLPGNMTLKFRRYIEPFRVTFHCNFCGKDGHTQSRCELIGANSNKVVTGSGPNPINLVSKDKIMEASTSKAASRFRIRDIAEENAVYSPKPKSVLPRKDIEAFAREIGKEEAHRYYNSYPLGSLVIKEEKAEPSSNDSNSSMKRSSFTNVDNNHEPVMKKVRTASTNEMIPQFNEDASHLGQISKASSTTTEPDPTDLQILYQKTPPCADTFSDTLCRNVFNLTSQLDGFFRSTRNLPEDPGVVTTSNQPEAVSDRCKSELPSDENDSDSNQQSPSPRNIVKKRKKTPQIVPIVIPDGIRLIVERIEGVLNVSQLEAFFNHVKKKSCPAEFAKVYTSDVEGLKRQLNDISKQYYLTPKAGTNSEIKFMKWLGSVLNRFDGTPARVRAKTEQV